MNLRALAPIAALLLAGCGGVFTRNPASDDETTKADTTLIGVWRAEPLPEREGEQAFIAVGRSREGEEAMVLAWITLDPEGYVDSKKGGILTTVIGPRRYVTILSDPSANEPTNMVCKYALSAEGDLRVFTMDPERVAAEVRAEKIAGTVEAKDGEEPTVTLTATTKDLRAWLERAGEGIFRMTQPIVYRRVKRP